MFALMISVRKHLWILELDIESDLGRDRVEDGLQRWE